MVLKDRTAEVSNEANWSCLGGCERSLCMQFNAQWLDRLKRQVCFRSPRADKHTDRHIASSHACISDVWLDGQMSHGWILGGSMGCSYVIGWLGLSWGWAVLLASLAIVIWR